MAFKRKGYNPGDGTGMGAELGMENPGSKYNETWAEPDYDNLKTLDAYGSDYTTLEDKVGEERMSKMSQYRQDKIRNRSEVSVQRHLDDEQRKTDRGTGKSKREIRRANRARRRAQGGNFFQRLFNK